MATEIKKQQLNTGLTLVEIIVAVGLFLVVATMATGSLLTIMDANRKAKSMRTAMDNLNVAIERMVRELRTGASYYCNYTSGNIYNFLPPPVGTPQTADCVDGDDSIVFLSQDGRTIVYRENAGTGTIERSPSGGSTFTSILAPNVNITSLRYYVNGTSPYGTASPESQAHVIISIEGNVTEAGIDSAFHIQTMATQRSPE